MKKTELPANEKTFQFNVIGDITDTEYTGEFTVVCVPTIRQKSQTAILEAKLNQDMATLDDATRAIHRFIATLRYRVIKAPKWWEDSAHGMELKDDNIVFELWKKLTEAEVDWYRAVHPDKADELQLDVNIPNVEVP